MPEFSISSTDLFECFFFVCLFVFANITLSYVGFPGSGMDTNNNSAIMNQPAMQEIQG